jgi:hypothetical protein
LPTDEETASAPGQVDNPILAKEFALDWLRRELKSTIGAPTKSEDAFDCYSLMRFPEPPL